MAGLPGTGLGGIFYALLIIWMAVREVWLSAHNRTSQKRWQGIVTFGLILAAIVAVLAAEFWLIQYATEHWIGPIAGPGVGIYAYLKALAPTLIVTPFVILGTMLVLLHLASWLLSPPTDPARPSSL